MALIYTAMALTFLGVMGMAVVENGSKDADSTANFTDVIQADALSTAGMEWAKWRLNNGEDPRSIYPVGLSRISLPGSMSRTVSASPATRYAFGPAEFGDGTFEVTSDPENGSVTSIGKSGAATVSHTMEPTYASECFEYFGTPDFNFPPGTQGSLDDVGFRLNCPEDCEAADSCLDQLIIKGMTVSWTDAVTQQGVTAILIAAEDSSSDDFVSYNQNSTNGYAVTGSPSTQAVSGDLINTADYTLDDQADHSFKTFAFQYSPGGFQPRSGTDFTITSYFKDGTTESVTYTYLDTDGDGIADGSDPDDDGDGTPDGGDSDCTGVYCDLTLIDWCGGAPCSSCDTDADGDCDCNDDGSCTEGNGDCTGKFCGEIGIYDPTGGDDGVPLDFDEGVMDPCRIADDMGAEGGDGCASDGDAADNPGDSYGDGCQTCGPNETPPNP